MRTLVVARFDEDVSWLEQLPADWRIYLYNKGVSEVKLSARYSVAGVESHGEERRMWLNIMQNYGREAAVYLNFIVTNYNFLKGDIVFCQANPFPHDANFLRHIEEPDKQYFGFVEASTPEGFPRCEWAHLHEYCRVFGLPVLSSYEYVSGAQFRVSAEQIKARPLAFYEALHALSKLCDFKFACTMERLWPLVFGFKCS